MASDTAATAPESDCEIMASVESDTEGERLIMAELCRDDAWLAMSMDATVPIETLR
jgi:hypothetical protein